MASSDKVAARKRQRGDEGAPQSQASACSTAEHPAHHTRPSGHESLHEYLHSSIVTSTKRSGNRQKAMYSPARAPSEAQLQHWAFMHEMLQYSSAPVTASPTHPLDLPHHAHLAHAAHAHLQQGCSAASALSQLGRGGVATAGAGVRRGGEGDARKEVKILKSQPFSSVYYRHMLRS